MKRFYFLFLNLIIGLTIYANPLSEPTVEISELYFDNSGNWKLELQYLNYDFIPWSFDSVYIYSSTDTAKIPDNFINFGNTVETAFIIITKDSLITEFNINKLGDTLKVITFYSGYPFEDILIFGDVLGASINYPKQGQSICKYSYCFVKDNSPTLGNLNDTTGIFGTIKGIMYDKYLGTVNNRFFYIDNLIFETSSKGEYEARVFSKPSVFNYITYQWISKGTTFGRTASVTEISYVMEPDSVIDLDIYLLDTLVTGIKKIDIKNDPVSVYPNPVFKDKELNVTIDLPVETSDIYLELYDLSGRLYRKTKIVEKTNIINMPPQKGIYLLNILLDSRVISSSKILVNE